MDSDSRVDDPLKKINSSGDYELDPAYENTNTFKPTLNNLIAKIKCLAFIQDLINAFLFLTAFNNNPPFFLKLAESYLGKYEVTPPSNVIIAETPLLQHD